MQQAVLFLTDKTSEFSLDAFDGLVKEAAGLADVFLVFHKKEDELPLDIRSRHPFVFTSSILHDLGYVPIGDSILPGNNHYPLFYFYKCHSHYNYYWIVEDDVRYTGNWHDFLMAFDDDDADLLSSNVTRYPQDQYWYWWHTLETGASEIQKSRWVHSFNPIYRLSSRAITAIDHLLCSGWRGHHEVVLPTAVSYLGMKIEDFGGNGEFVSLGNENRFYDSATMDCRAVEYDPSDKNKLYHPVKEEKGISDTSRLKPNCVIISAGKDSLHRELFEGERDFDVHLLVFDDSYNKHCNDTDFIVAMSGYKMDMTYRYLQRHPEYLSHYEYFFLMDDDIRITTASVNRLFQLMREYSLRIAQPSLVLSYYTYEHTLHNPACKLRYTNFVEMMAPCFSREALVKVLPTFEEKVRWRGIEFHWAKLIESNKHDMAIIDELSASHATNIRSWNEHYNNLTKDYIKEHSLSSDLHIYSQIYNDYDWSKNIGIQQESIVDYNQKLLQLNHIERLIRLKMMGKHKLAVFFPIIIFYFSYSLISQKRRYYDLSNRLIAIIEKDIIKLNNAFFYDSLEAIKSLIIRMSNYNDTYYNFPFDFSIIRDIWSYSEIQNNVDENSGKEEMLTFVFDCLNTTTTMYNKFSITNR